MQVTQKYLNGILISLFCYPCSEAISKPALVPTNQENIVVRAEPPQNGLAAQTGLGKVSLGPLGTMKVEDAPFSILGVAHDVIQNKQLRNVNDILNLLPSVQIEARGNSGIARPQSRGFESNVFSNSRMDGLNIVATTPYPAEMLENVQVLNGIAGGLYGPQNPAGIFEYTLKRPTKKPLRSLSLAIDSLGVITEHADVSDHVGKDNWFAYRLNLLHGNGTYYAADSWIRRNLISGDFDIHLSPRTVIELDVSHYTYVERGTPPTFSYDNTIRLPRAPDTSKSHLGQDYAGFNMETNTGMARIRHEFNKSWHLLLGGGFQDAQRKIFSNSNNILDNSGVYEQTIKAAATADDFKVGSNLAYLNGVVKTAFIRHALVLGTNGYISGNYNPKRVESATLGTATIQRPEAFSGHQPKSYGHYQSATTREQSLIFGDTLRFSKQISVMGVMNWSWISSTNWSKTGERTSHKSVDAAFSPLTSLIVHPFDNHTVYFTWGNSIQPGATAPATGVANPNQVLAPYRSEEYEIGYKAKVNDLWLNVAAFRMTRPYAFINPSTKVYSIGGMQRNYGVEFQASGKITHGLAVMGGVTWLDAQLGNTGNIATSHKQVVGVPPVQANLFLDYRLPLPTSSPLSGLAFNANVHYTGRRAANNYNSSFAASYVTADIGLRYPVRIAKRILIARFTVNNVSNEHYWQSVYPLSIDGGDKDNSAFAGQPRTFQFSLVADI